MTARTWRLSTTFTALHNRDFRWLWLGRLASSATFEMGGVAQGWLVYQLTGSAFALGWVGAGWSISTLVLSLYGGVITDRVEKRTLLLWTRVAMMLNSLVIGLLVSLQVIQVWHMALSSLFTGILFAFMMPAQQSIVSDLVDRETLMNAVSLNAVGMGLMGIFSAATAGQLIESIGVDTVYYVMGVFYLASIYTVIKLPRIGVRHSASGSIWVDLKDGLRYLRGNNILMAILALGLVRVLFAMPYRTLMPAFARDNLGFDARGLGLLLSAPGAGGLVSALILSSTGNMKGKGRLFITAGILMGLALAMFVTIPLLPATFLFIACTGAFNNVCMVMDNTLLQSHCDVAYRGRILSVYMMLWGLTPLGTLPAGAIADHVGVPWVVIIQGLMVALLFLGMGLLKPELKRLD